MTQNYFLRNFAMSRKRDLQILPIPVAKKALLVPCSMGQYDRYPRSFLPGLLKRVSDPVKKVCANFRPSNSAHFAVWAPDRPDRKYPVTKPFYSRFKHRPPHCPHSSLFYFSLFVLRYRNRLDRLIAPDCEAKQPTPGGALPPPYKIITTSCANLADFRAEKG